MDTQISEQIETLGKKLKERFNVQQIIIFGSHAYGKPDEESDIDLCIITDLKNKRKIEIIREMRRELIDLISNPLDILVYTENEFNERADLRNTLEHKIMLDGLKVYGK
jgi:predicted nucleotidyltransferase